MTHYLDASVIVAILVPETASEAIRKFLLGADKPLFVSEFAAAEVASALSRLVRTRDLTTAQAIEALADLDAWRSSETLAIRIDDLDIGEAALLVRQFELKLRAPDAIHLAVCLRSDAKLVTKDDTLGSAAEACGVTVIKF